MELTFSELLDQLRLSQVFESQQLDLLVPLIADCQPNETNDLVQQWVREEKLSSFQANKILAKQAATLVIGPYVLLRPLANGGMGQVYLAHSTQHRQRLVAVKLLATGFSDHPGYLKRFKREVELLRRLNHPSIVSVIDSGTSRNGMPYAVSVPYLVTEYIEGPTLTEYLSEQGTLAWQSALRLIRRLAIALGHAHQSQVLHRDIKPSNIILISSGGIKLLDFGLASSLSSSQTASKLTMTGDVLGTIDFAAPEQATGGAATIHSDIYSVGCTLYYCLCGRPPYQRSSSMEVARAHCFAPLPTLPTEFDGPTAVQELLNGLLAKSPSDRIQSADQLCNAIDAILNDAENSGGRADEVKLPDNHERDAWTETEFRDSPLPPLSHERSRP